MSNQVTETKGKASSAASKDNWSDATSEREIISWNAWVENKLQDQVIECWGVGSEVLKEGDEDMGDWEVLVGRLTKPIKNVGEDGKITEIPVGTDICMTMVFKLRAYKDIFCHPTEVRKFQIRMNGEKKLSGPRNPMKLFKVNISDQVGKRADIAPLTVGRFAAGAQAPALTSGASGTPLD